MLAQPIDTPRGDTPRGDRTKCLTREEIMRTVGEEGFVLNSDGTVSVFYINPKLGLYPVQLTLECCRVLDPTYYFDINTQTCRWAKPHDACGFSEPINLIVNPKGNDGTLFFIDDFEKETCDLKISFDYLLKIKCEDLLNITNPTVATNIQSQAIINQIIKTELEISEVNVQIETLTNEIILLNELYNLTPYSIDCIKFPTTTTTPDPINCVVSWSNWSACKNGQQTRTITSVLQQPMYGGTACPTSPQTQSCTVPVNCVVSNFGPCINGVQTRTIITQPANGGTACPALTQSCSVAPCVRPTNLAVTFYEANHIISNRTTPDEACALWNILQTPNNIYASDTGSPNQTASFAIGSQVYQGYNSTGCSGLPNGYHVIIGIGVVHITNNIIDGIYTSCPFIAPDAKMSAFNNSGFSPKSLNDSSLNDLTVFQRGSITTYSSVNFCLTDLGLQALEIILGPTRYQQFILGDPASYTCADVIALANLPNAADLFYSCDTPFGTKSQILVDINTHMTELNNLYNLLTELQNTLIKLQNSFETTIAASKGCQTPIEALESLDVEMHLDVVNPDNTLTSVFTYPIFPAINLNNGNLYNYIQNNAHSGFYICGDPSKDNVGLSNCTTLSLNENTKPNVDSCNSIVDDLVKALIRESGNASSTVPYDAFASPWLTYTHVFNNVTDKDIIAAITNKKIKISFRIKFSCVDFCLLLDNLVLDKTCKNVDRHNITISQNPGFDLKRVIDNKKSWIDTTTPTNREFLIAKNNGNNPIRQTDYNVNDERLVINSKEIDLDISVASAIETDVWCYLNDNPCTLTAACTSTIASTTNNPIEPGQTIVFSGTFITISDCTSYNGKLANRTANLIETTSCGTITRFNIKEGFPLTYVYYWLVQQPNGDIGYFRQDTVSFINISNVYQNGKDCCEYLNKDLKTYNKAVSYNNKIEVYWDEDCQRCKVEKARCGDVNLNLHSLLTQPISAVTTIEQFENLMITEFIDVKNRQTISSYPTLRAVYDRYLNSSKYCNMVSSAFDYQNMDKFAGLIGSYWVDLIEQVVPSTTIWGSVKIYTNTIFDEQKFKYKPYSILIDKNPFQGQQVLSPINGVDGICQGVNVISKDLPFSNTKRLSASNTIPKVDIFNNLCIAQMNSGSEFISYVQVKLLPPPTPTGNPCATCEQENIPWNLNNTNIRYMVNNLDNTKMYSSTLDGRIIVINTFTNTITNVITTGINGTEFMIYLPTKNKLYIFGTDNVVVINTITDTVIGSPINIVGISSGGEVYVPDNDCIYIPIFNGNSVVVLETINDTVVTTIPTTITTNVRELVYNSDLKRLYVNLDGKIDVIDVTNNSVVYTITALGTQTYLNIYYNKNNSSIYAFNELDGKLFLIDTSNYQINSLQLSSNSYLGGSNAFGIPYNPSTKYYYVFAREETFVIDTTNDTLVITLNKHYDTAIYASTNNMYLGYLYNGFLDTLDSSNTIIETNIVNPKSDFAIFNPKNDTIYVASYFGYTMIKCINNKPKSQSVIQTCNFDGNLTYNNGTLTPVTVGGTLPFSYVWSNGATTPTINATTAGNYTVIVTDANCCKFTAQYEIIVP